MKTGGYVVLLQEESNEGRRGCVRQENELGRRDRRLYAVKNAVKKKIRVSLC